MGELICKRYFRASFCYLFWFSRQSSIYRVLLVLELWVRHRDGGKKWVSLEGGIYLSFSERSDTWSLLTLGVCWETRVRKVELPEVSPHAASHASCEVYPKPGTSTHCTLCLLCYVLPAAATAPAVLWGLPPSLGALHWREQFWRQKGMLFKRLSSAWHWAFPALGFADSLCLSRLQNHRDLLLDMESTLPLVAGLAPVLRSAGALSRDAWKPAKGGNYMASLGCPVHCPQS